MADDLGNRFGPRTIKRTNAKRLTLACPNPQSLEVPIRDGEGSSDNEGDDIVTVEFKLDVMSEDLTAEDLVTIKDLGYSSSGELSLVQHGVTNVIMVRKVLHVANNSGRKRIVRELQIMRDCNSSYLVTFYGAFQDSAGDVVISTEYMNLGSLDRISAASGPIRVDVLGKIAEAVFGSLAYLYSTHRIMHRDVRPSKILVNSDGEIKLCGFGNSRELDGSIADTFTGSSTYMAPERIKGESYTVRSDVWSAGLTLMELAIGKYPYVHDEPGNPAGILDLFQDIVFEPSPKLPESDAFPIVLHQLMGKCLMKNPTDRPTSQELYESDGFVIAAKLTAVNLKGWADSIKS